MSPARLFRRARFRRRLVIDKGGQVMSAVYSTRRFDWEPDSKEVEMIVLELRPLLCEMAARESERLAELLATKLPPAA
jgi:hypothetical protein